MVRASGVFLIAAVIASGPVLAQGAAQGTSAGERRVLLVGQDLRPGEVVTTGTGEQKPVLAPDGASLTVGPSSEVVLDKFQFDAATRTGEIALTVRRGSLRYGGGTISRSSDVVVAAGTSQVRIRGATALIGVQPQGVEVRLVVGERVSVTAEGVTQTVSQPDGVIMVPAGRAPVIRTANTARAEDWLKSFRDLDTMNRAASRVIESSQSQGGRVTSPVTIGR